MVSIQDITDKHMYTLMVRGIYCDADSGFDSVVNTYRKANQVLNTIAVAAVNAFVEKSNKGLINQLNRVGV